MQAGLQESGGFVGLTEFYLQPVGKGREKGCPGELEAFCRMFGLRERTESEYETRRMWDRENVYTVKLRLIHGRL